MEQVNKARSDSQAACRLFLTSLDELLISIWWYAPPSVIVKLETAEMSERWTALSPTFFLSSIMPSLYAGETQDASLRVLLTSTTDQIVVTWNALMDVFRWTPRDWKDTPPVFWKYPELVQLSQLFADAMSSFHLYIYMSMCVDLDLPTQDEFFKVIQQMDQWVSAFKRTWQKAVWVDKSFDEVKPVVKVDVQFQLDALPRLPLSK